MAGCSYVTSRYLVKSSKPLTMTALLTIAGLVDEFAFQLLENACQQKIAEIKARPSQKALKDKKIALLKEYRKIAWGCLSLACTQAVHSLSQRLKLNPPSFFVTWGILGTTLYLNSIFESLFTLIKPETSLPT